MNKTECNDIQLKQAIARYGIPNILLADDSLTQQFVIKAVLQNVGLMLDCVDDGLQALDQIKSKQYDLILMDIQMPMLDGISATKQIRQQYSLDLLPIIALTGDTDLDEQSEAMTSLFNAFLSKPVDSTDLIDVLMSFWLPQNDSLVLSPLLTDPLSDNRPVTNSIAQLALHPSFDLSGGVYEWVGEAAYLRVLNAFIRVYKPYVVAVQTGGKSALTRAEQHRFFHKLKSAAANIGAIGLLKVVESVELDADNSMNDLCYELERVINMLEPLALANRK
ncbi:response regulator [Shewanella sp.]|uniref:response regulator n=1 Tax=Shewanella sp. TaxID=50422 RepID=UPI0040483BBB